MNQNDIILGKYQLEGESREYAVWEEYSGVGVEDDQAILATVIKSEFVPARDFLTRFELVAEKLKEVDSPFGAALLDYGEHEGQAVVIQQLVEGQTLAAMLTDSDGLPENLVLDIAGQVGEYLQELHQADLVHGYLSLDSILLSSKGTAHVRHAGLAQGIALNALLADEVIEITAFHAPELRAGDGLTPAVDFYALGGTLYELLTGVRLELEPGDLWPGNQKPGLSPELDELVYKCLQADPGRRMQSAAEMLNGVEEVRRASQAGAQDTILGMEDALVGHSLGNYQLVERLGQGGMATVYKAYEPALDRYVAIKVLPQFFARDPNFMNRFRREAKAVAQLNHPSIMPIYSYGEEGDITYIAMQFVPGGTLKQGKGQVYGPEEALQLVLPIVRALAYAHGRGIVHRDIKPSNVLISEDGWPILADFGLAKMAEASQQLTGTGVGVGTPMYMSPEQGQGTGVDHRTDIYSLGIMLYEMLTGDVPFRADTPMAVVIKHMTAPLPMPRQANSDIPEALERVILKATAKSPEDRYQTADEMITALERVQNSLLAPSRDVEIPEEAAPALEEPAAPPKDAAPLAGTLKKAGVILGGVVGVLLFGVILMWVFDICPPAGPWPIPPWCPGTTYQVPTIGGEEDTAAIITDGALGSILFQEDFEEGLSSRWIFHPTTWNIDGDSGRTVLRSAPFDSTKSEMVTGEVRDTTWQNYAIEFDFRFSEPDQFGAHYFWLRGRITDCPPTVQSMRNYGVLISTDKVMLTKDVCVSGSSGQNLVENDKDIAAEGWHTLQYVFISNRMQLFIDGEKYVDYTDTADPFDGGDLWIEPGGDGELLIDNLKVYEVIPGEGSVGQTISKANLCSPGETLLLYENFEAGYQAGWLFKNPVGVETEPWSIVDDGTGNYVIQAHEHNWAYYTGFNQSDIEFRLRMRKGMQVDSTHINFGASETGRYFLAVADQIDLYKEPDIALLSTGSYSSQTEWHEIKITSIGGYITVYLDGELKLEYQDPDPLPDGAIAIENSWGTIWYDDIVVCSVTAETETSSQPGADVIAQGEALFLDSGLRLGDRHTRVIASGDVDGDGYVDFITGNSWQTNLVWTNTGGNLFIQGFESSQQDDTYTVAPGDYDGDGDLDLFVANWGSPSYVLFNSGAGDFERSHVLTSSYGISEAFGAASGDLDGDSDLDIWMASGGKNFVWKNDGEGNFAIYGDVYEGRDSVGVDLGDLDGDGDLDAFVANYVGGANFVFLNQGDGTFVDSGQRMENLPSNNVALGDLDGDGDLDAFVVNLEDQPNTVWFNNGGGAFADSGQRLDQLTSNVVALGDLDNDGDLDAYVVNGKIDAGVPKSNTIYMNDGLGNFSEIEHVANLTISTDVVLLDLNGDGWLDVIEATAETILVYFNRGNFGQTTEDQTGSFDASPILTAIAERQPDFQDDFSDPASGWSAGTLQDEPHYGESGYIDGEYFVTAFSPVSSGDTACMQGRLLSEPQYSDFVLDVDARFVTGGTGSLIVQFRDWFNELTNQYGKYSAGLDTGTMLFINRGDIGQTVDLAMAQGLEGINPGLETNSLRVIAQGTQIALYINGSPALYIDDEGVSERFASGWFKFLVCNKGSAPLQVNFDNLKIWDLSDDFAEQPVIEAQYADDFEQGFAEFWDTSWSIEQVNGANAAHGRGELIWAGETPLEDFALEADVFLAAPSVADGWYGAVFVLRSTDCPAGSLNSVSFYRLSIFDFGQAVEKITCDSDQAEFLPGDTIDLGLDDWHHVRVQLVDDQIQVYLNEVQLVDYVDGAPLLSGGVSLSATSGEDITYFDNFSLEVYSSGDETSASSPCGFTLDQVGETAKVSGTIAFVDDTVPNVWYADLTGDGCTLGISVDSGQYPSHKVWFDNAPEAFAVGASIIVEGTFVSFPSPDNPEQMQLILELTAQPQVQSP